MNPLLLQDQFPTGLYFAFFIPFFIMASVLAVWRLVCMWIIFTKAGEEGWKAIIPIYNAIVLLKIVGKPWWWILLYLLFPFTLIWVIWTYNMLSKSFGKDAGFTVGLVFVDFVFLPLLAFGNAAYQGPFGNQAAYEAYRGVHTFDFEKQQPQ